MYGVSHGNSTFSVPSLLRRVLRICLVCVGGGVKPFLALAYNLKFVVVDGMGWGWYILVRIGTYR